MYLAQSSLHSIGQWEMFIGKHKALGKCNFASPFRGEAVHSTCQPLLHLLCCREAKEGRAVPLTVSRKHIARTARVAALAQNKVISA